MKIGKNKTILFGQNSLKSFLKDNPEKAFTIEEAKAYSKKLIKKWASEK